jgi:hypothetical protein
VVAVLARQPFGYGQNSTALAVRDILTEQDYVWIRRQRIIKCEIHGGQKSRFARRFHSGISSA